jgi:putative Ca2+/H+ antiporter (TMEM165/GDT1 family)
MDLRLLVTVFSTIFIAELGDKTQLSTMLYASGAQNSKWIVFLGAALALVVSSALGVFAGSIIGSRINPKLLSRIAGAGFIAVGIWTLIKAQQ